MLHNNNSVASTIIRCRRCSCVCHYDWFVQRYCKKICISTPNSLSPFYCTVGIAHCTHFKRIFIVMMAPLLILIIILMVEEKKCMRHCYSYNIDYLIDQTMRRFDYPPQVVWIMLIMTYGPIIYLCLLKLIIMILIILIKIVIITMLLCCLHYRSSTMSVSSSEISIRRY